MFALLLSVALARDGTSEAWPPPYTVNTAPNGDVRVVDGAGRTVPASKVLRLLDHDDAGTYVAHHAGRKTLGFLGWIGGSAMMLFGAVDNQQPIGIPLIVGGAGLVSGGYVVLYAPKEERLDHWVTRAEVEAGLATYGPGAPPPVADRGWAPGPATWSDPDEVARDRVLWAVDAKGRVEDRAGRLVTVDQVARALGDEEREAAWNRWRMEQYGTWLGVASAGIGISTVGVVLMSSYQEAREYNAGLGTLGVGVAMMAGGVVGLTLVESPAHVQRWFTPAELEQAVRASRGIAEVEPERTPMVRVMPTIAPGYLGIAGTF